MVNEDEKLLLLQGNLLFLLALWKGKWKPKSQEIIGLGFIHVQSCKLLCFLHWSFKLLLFLLYRHSHVSTSSTKSSLLKRSAGSPSFILTPLLFTVPDRSNLTQKSTRNAFLERSNKHSFGVPLAFP